jgi:hypothetical protein
MTLMTEQTATLDADEPLPSGRSKLASSLDRAIHSISAVIIGGVRRVEGNMVPVAICAAIMFPAYWFIWKYLFPQPYENIGIRVFGSLLCLVIAAKDRWPRSLRRYLPVAWLGTVFYSGPFFFTFMLLQNDNSTVWLMSTMAGLFLVVLLLDWISVFVLFIAGSVLAWRVHLIVSPDVAAVGLYLEYVPIFLFALTAGTIFNYKAAGLRQAKERARLELGMLLAKEMQSPLVSIRTNVASLSKFLPRLVRAYPENRGEPGAPDVVARQLGALERVPARIDEAVEQMGGIIETLMIESGDGNAARQQRASSMLRCLDDAMARLSFATELDRARIVVDRQYDFLFHGSPVLMVHALARVLDSALHEIYSKTGAELDVRLGRVSGWNYLRLTDSSAGLSGTAGRLLAGLSGNDRDFSSRPDLALANLVLERMGGSVTRTFAFGRAGETVLWFAQPGG